MLRPFDDAALDPEVKKALDSRWSVVTARAADGETQTVRLIRKFTAEAIEKDAANNGRVRITITTEDEDRDGDILPVEGWDFTDYMKAPIVLFDHDYGVVAGSPPSQGRTIDLQVMKKRVKAVVEFHRQNKFNEELYQMYSGGWMFGDSVGFALQAPPELRDRSNGMGKGLIFPRKTLLEHSLVAVGANQNALVEAATKGLIRPKTAEYLASLDPLAGSTRFGAGEKSHDAARDHEEASLVAGVAGLLAHSLVTRRATRA